MDEVSGGEGEGEGGTDFGEWVVAHGCDDAEGPKSVEGGEDGEGVEGGWRGYVQCDELRERKAEIPQVEQVPPGVERTAAVQPEELEGRWAGACHSWLVGRDPRRRITSRHSGGAAAGR